MWYDSRLKWEKKMLKIINRCHKENVSTFSVYRFVVKGVRFCLKGLRSCWLWVKDDDSKAVITKEGNIKIMVI